jgi:hypothetical protein
MGSSNAERQARWRKRLQKRLANLERAAKVGSAPPRTEAAEITRLKAHIADLEAGEPVTEPLRNGGQKARITELQQERDRLRKENVFLQTRIDVLEMIAGHKSFIPRETYRKILACLHPDRGAGDKMLGEAFAAFRELEYTLVNDQRERKAKAKRDAERAKRAAKKAAAQDGSEA